MNERWSRNTIVVWARSLVDIRPGEGRKTALMFTYYLLVLSAYYILKPLSRALFLDNLDADRLPWLYIFMALLGGTGATLISKAALRSRLTDVIGWTQLFLISNILAIWWLLQYPSVALLYAFSIWVGTFSIITVGQFWMLASSLFDPRSARRVFTVIGIAAVIGSASGGVFTSTMVDVIGPRHLMLASGSMIAITWFVVRALRGYEEVRKPHEAATEFRLRDTLALVGGSPHLRAVSLLVCAMFVVDTLVDYQFSVMAKQSYQKEQLVGFLALFQGVYFNLISFALQFFLMGKVLRHLGVGGALAFAPIAVAAGSSAFLASPSIVTASITRAAEAATRYTFTRTGIELLYLPLPRDIKNRTKIFLDVFVDRVSRGAAGGLLLLLTTVFAVSLRGITLVILGVIAVWLVTIYFVLRTYVGILKESIEKREVHFEEMTVDPSDAATIRVLLRALDSENPREVVYALSLLEQVPRVSLGQRATQLVESSSPEIRTATLRLLALRRDPVVVPHVRPLLQSDDPSLKAAVVHYLCQADPNPSDRLREFLVQPDLDLRLAAVVAAEQHPYPRPLTSINNDWFQQLMSGEADKPERARSLAATALPLADPAQVPVLDHLRQLLADSSTAVVNTALGAAANMKLPPDMIPLLTQCLEAPATRSSAREVLRAQGEPVLSYIRDRLVDGTINEGIRRNFPRLLGDIASATAAEVLTSHLPNSAIPMRFEILKALNRIRRDQPEIPIPGDVIDATLVEEVRRCYELMLSMDRDNADSVPGGKLLQRSLEERLDQALERVFRLLGLRYPADEIYDAYRAVRSPQSQRRAAAVEFLDNTLGQPYKKMIVPLIEDSGWERLDPVGPQLFGLEPRNLEQSLEQLIRGDDKWLKMMAMYRAAELQLHSLEEPIRMAASDSDQHIAETASYALSIMNSGARVARTADAAD